MSCRDLDILGKDYFRDHSQFRDCWNSKKRRPNSPDFIHTYTREPLWKNDWHNPPWVSGELHKRRYKQHTEHALDHTTLFDLIKTCSEQKDLHKGSQIHADLLERGLLQNLIPLSNAILTMYVKCGALSKAQELFDELPTRNVITWNALIAGYVQHGLGGKALSCFEQMQQEGFVPNAVTFICILKACGSIGALQKGEEIQLEIRKQNLLGRNNVLGTALVDMYAKCGALTKAQGVFNELSERDVVMWNALISGYTQHGYGDEALCCFQRMCDEGFSPNTVTFICILKACGSIGALEKGEAIHMEIDKLRLLEKDNALRNTLVDMYAKCGAIAKAQEVFNGLPRKRDVATWNVLIAGYVQHGLNNEALNCFERMQKEGFLPDGVTFASIFKACGSIGAAKKSEEIHAEVCRQGLLEIDLVLGNALVDMYVKCGVLAKAQDVCKQLPARDVVTWTSLIAGYVQCGHGDEALRCFDEMQGGGLCPNEFTYVCILKACGNIGAVQKGAEIHAEVTRQGLLERDGVLGTALVDMYAKCGVLGKAQGVFDKLSVQNVATWNALITGYAKNGCDKEALRCVEQMQDQGFSPDVVTFISTLNACGNIGAAEKGEEIHGDVSRKGLLERDLVLGNALVDMYAKCGDLAKGQGVFDKLPARNVTTWTALIAGYAQFGKVKEVFNSFNKMIGDGIEPNTITFNALLTSCSHTGLVEEGQRLFDTMSTVYCIIPTLDHYTCLVDSFSRAGRLDIAISLFEYVPPSECRPLWSTLMGALRNEVNLEIGRWAFQHAIRLDGKRDAAYICMSSLYAVAGLQD